MLYVFYGKDDFSVREALYGLKRSTVANDFFETNISKFHVTSTSPKQIEEICNTIPFFGSKRLVVVEGLLSIFERSNSRSSQGEESLSGWINMIEYLKTLPDTTDLILLDGEIRSGNRFLDGIRGFSELEVEVKEFTPITGDHLKIWVQKRTSRSGSTISREATQLLMDLVGNNLWVLNNEIEKLSLYCTDRNIESEDVLQMVSFSREMTIFNAIDALFENRDSDFLRIIQQLIDTNSTGNLITMLSRQVRLLLVAKELVQDKVNRSDITKRLSVQQWLADRLVRVSNRYSGEALINIHESLLQCDIGIKNGIIFEESIGKVILEVMNSIRLKSASKM